jgi:hypothetical protein
MEETMTPQLVFQIANPAALLGWIILAAAIFLKRPFWRDVVAGQVWPAAFSIIYTILLFFFWSKAEGGFDSLENVQKLFTSPWVALAGWIHYLAFDLIVGSLIARRVIEQGLPRSLLIVLLPLTFLFGPIGLVGFQIAQMLFRKVEV